MTDSDSQDIPANDSAEENATPPLAEEDSTGDPWLDKLLSEGVLKGHARLDLAQTCLAAFMIVALGWIVYSITASSPFLLGDQAPLVEQEALHHIATISRAWDAQISPISAFTFAFNWMMGDGSPIPFQSTQIIIHLLNALLVFLLCRALVKDRDTEAIPMIAGLLFAVHPLSGYTVNTLIERDLLLATLFMMLSLVLYVSAIQSERTGWTRIVLSMIAFGLAWSCGTWTWVLPILVVLVTLAVDGWSGLKKNAACIILYLPVTVLLLLSETLLLDSADERRISLLTPFRDANHLSDYLYAWGMPGSEPWGYVPGGESVGFPVLLAGFLIVGGVALVKSPRVAFMLLWPAILVIGTGTGLASDSFQNTHIYPASIGFALILPAIVAALPKGTPRTTSGVVATAAILVCFGITNTRNTDWKDEIYFWNRANEECSTCSEPILRLAQAYEAEGDRLVDSLAEGDVDTELIGKAKRNWETAEGFYRLADESNIVSTAHLESYARVQHAQAKLDDALVTMKRVIVSEPDNLDAIRSLAQWYSERFPVNRDPKDLQYAIAYYQNLESRDSITDSDRLTWAGDFYQLGAHPMAGAQLQQVQDRDVRTRATALLQQLNPRLGAIASQKKAFDDAVGRQAPLPEVLRIRASQYAAEGRFTNARYMNEELIRLTGNTSLEDWMALAQTSSILGEWDTFVAHWVPPTVVENPWYKLAEYTASQKRWSVALQALMERPQFSDSVARPEALLTLGKIALNQNEPRQAANIYQQMIQENPKRHEPWLALADMAIDAKQSEAVKEYLRQAEARGAAQADIESRRSRANIKQSPADLLKPTIIQ